MNTSLFGYVPHHRGNPKAGQSSFDSIAECKGADAFLLKGPLVKGGELRGDRKTVTFGCLEVQRGMI